MSESTGIQWTSATWNPVQGCHRVSTGCARCYMFRDKERYGQDPNVVVRSAKATFEKPLRWQREAERGDRAEDNRLVFTCSWSDWFIEEADPWREEMWAIVRACPLLTFQILTKRTGRIAGHLPADWGAGYPNVWLGVSVEDQAAATDRVHDILGVPASVRFLSVEPLIAPVDLRMWLGLVEVPRHREHWPVEMTRRFWAIIGGESGNATGRYKARPCNVDWIRDLVRQCKASGVPCFVKQLGSNPYVVRYNENSTTDCGDEYPVKLKDPHGGDWDEWPDDLRVRQFPGVPAPVATVAEPRAADLPGQSMMF